MVYMYIYTTLHIYSVYIHIYCIYTLYYSVCILRKRDCLNLQLLDSFNFIQSFVIQSSLPFTAYQAAQCSKVIELPDGHLPAKAFRGKLRNEVFYLEKKLTAKAFKKLMDWNYFEKNIAKHTLSLFQCLNIYKQSKHPSQYIQFSTVYTNSMNYKKLTVFLFL